METTSGLDAPAAARTPPLFPGLPILGSTLSLLRDPLAVVLAGYRAKGPVFRLRVLGRSFVVLAGPEAMREVKDLGGDILLAAPQYGFFNEELKTDRFILALDGPVHIEMRKLLRRGYSKQAALDALQPMVDFAESEVRTWPLSKPLDIVLRLKELVVRQLTISMLGYDPGPLLPDIQVFLTVALRVHQYRALPRLALRLPRYRRAVANLYDVTKKIVEAYEQRGKNDSALLSDLLLARDSQNEPFAPHVHRAIVIGTLLAGLDTVAITAAFALYALLAHPMTLAKAQEEVDRVAPDGRLDAQRLESMEYLHAVVLETLRRFPVMSGMARTAGRDFDIAGYRVTQGEEVLLSPVVGHFVERYFPDPERFDPERMLPPRLEHRQRLAFAPFGAGSHTCLGAGFGELELVSLLYTFVRNLELELVPREYKLRIAVEVTRRPKRDFRIRIAGYRR